MRCGGGGSTTPETKHKKIQLMRTCNNKLANEIISNYKPFILVAVENISSLHVHLYLAYVQPLHLYIQLVAEINNISLPKSIDWSNLSIQVRAIFYCVITVPVLPIFNIFMMSFQSSSTSYQLQLVLQLYMA